MKNNFLSKTVMGALLLLLAVTFACKDEFLEVPAAGALSDAQLTSEAGLEGLLVGAYSMLGGRSVSGSDQTQSGQTNWMSGSVRGGEANKGTDPGDQAASNPVQGFSMIPTDVFANWVWVPPYEGVTRCNTLLNLLDKADESVSEATKTRIRAEARFLRGMYYFQLTKIFNKVPYIDETVTAPSEVKNEAAPWAQIEADFQFAASNLPATQSAAGRANSWAAKAFLAKAMLFQGKHAQALPIFTDVIENGVTTSGAPYDLMDTYNEAFDMLSENGPEHVFSIQAAANTGTTDNTQTDFILNFTYTGGPAGCCGFFQPSFEMMNSYRTVNGLPLLDGSYNSEANKVKTDMGLTSDAAFTPDQGPLDPRIDWVGGRRGIPYLDWGNHPGNDWVRNQVDAGPYSPKKFVFAKSQQSSFTDGSSWTSGFSAVNYSLMRFADVLLMAAECEIEAGSVSKAWGYINRVRERAANPAGFVTNADGSPAANYQVALYDGSGNQDQARQAVRMERKLELSQEGHRFFDLLRWGVAEPVLNAYLNHERQYLPSRFGGATFSSNQDEYFPIPQTQIDLSPAGVLTQNPGY